MRIAGSSLQRLLDLRVLQELLAARNVAGHVARVRKLEESLNQTRCTIDQLQRQAIEPLTPEDRVLIEVGFQCFKTLERFCRTVEELQASSEVRLEDSLRLHRTASVKKSQAEQLLRDSDVREKKAEKKRTQSSADDMYTFTKRST